MLSFTFTKYKIELLCLITVASVNLYSFGGFFKTNNSTKPDESPNKEMIIVLDYQHDEVFAKTLNTTSKSTQPTDSPGGIGAISLCLLVALEGQNTPILTSTSLVNNILNHKRLFLDFAKKTISELTSKYNKYKRFNSYTEIQKFEQLCKYYYKKYRSLTNYLETSTSANKICQLPEFSDGHAPISVRAEPSNEMSIYMMAARTNITQNWIIKKVDKELVLLIPKKLLKGDLPLIDDKNLSSAEKELGLKFQHLKTVKVDSILNYKAKFITSTNSFIKALPKIFAEKSDYKSTEKVPTWAFYITGHGIPTINSKVILEQLQALKKHYKNIIKNEEFSSCYKGKNHKAHLKTCKKHHHFKRKLNDLDSIKNEIDKLHKQQAYLSYLHKGIIVSLGQGDFQKMLIFFNNNINTGFLFYSSCYAGGEHLVNPYENNNEPLVLNYHVISGTLAENMSLQETPYLRIPPYSKFRLTPEDISAKQSRLKIRTTLNYKKFFKAVKNGEHKNPKNLNRIVSYLHPFTKADGSLAFESLRNIPSYRPANSKSFSVLPGGPSFTVFNKENCRNKAKENLKVTTQANLIYSDYIPYSLNLEKHFNPAPAFVSMTPGLAAHVIEEINAPQYSLCALLNGFLVFAELKAPKIFWIKKLICKNTNDLNLGTLGFRGEKNIILHDVIILRNIFTSECLKNTSSKSQADAQNCILFTKYSRHIPNSSKTYKINWTGCELKPDNSKISDVISKKYARELIAYKPNILDHTFKTVKNILNLPVSIIA